MTTVPFPSQILVACYGLDVKSPPEAQAFEHGPQMVALF